MPVIHSIRNVTLATLLAFGSSCSCVIVRGTPIQGSGSHQAGKPPASHTSHKPRPTAHKPTQPGKPPAPAHHVPKPDPKPDPQPTPQRHPQPQPQPPPDAKPPAPAPGVTAMVVPVRVAFADAVEKIDALIEKTAAQDWQTVSASGAVTRVEVKYKIWREPIAATFEDHTLKVHVKVHYAADVRASAKNPLGGRIWITKGITWGTKSEPQDISADFHANFTIADDFSVKAKAGLDGIHHGKVPSGNVCVKSVVKLCVTKEAIAPMVHKRLEGFLVPRIEKALNDADKAIDKALNLKKQAGTVWTALQQPQSLQQLGQANCPTEAGAVCKTPAWLVAQPASVGVSQPQMDGKDLRVDLAVTGKLSVLLGDKPDTQPTPLPKLQTVTDPPGFAVHARLQVPTAILGSELNKRLKDQHIGGVDASNLVVAGVSLAQGGDSRHPKRVQVVVSVRGPVTADLKLQGELAWSERSSELFIKDLDYSVATDDPALKQLSAANHAALLKLLAAKAHWKLDTKTAALRKAITHALDGVWRGHLNVEGELSHIKLESFSIRNGVLAADVLLTGQLGVSLTP